MLYLVHIQADGWITGDSEKMTSHKQDMLPLQSFRKTRGGGGAEFNFFSEKRGAYSKGALFTVHDNNLNYKLA